MKRPKALGLIVVLALALTALLGASSASASVAEFKASSVPSTWIGTTTNSHELSLPTYPYGFHNCEDNFTGTMVSKSATTITAVHRDSAGEPQLHCANQFGTKVTWTMGSCEYKFHAGNYLLAGTMDIVNCGSSPMSFTQLGCTITIGNQTGLENVAYKNTETGGQKEVVATASLIHLTYTNGSGCEKPGVHSDGTYTGAWNIKGYTKVGGPQASIWAEAPAPTTFAAEAAPVTIAGSDSGYRRVMYFPEAAEVWCSAATFSGTSSSATFAGFTVVPAYHECDVWIRTGPTKWQDYVVPDKNIAMGDCSYEFQENGGFGIVGSTCASNPIVVTAPGCVVTAGGPKSGSIGKYVNAGSGKARQVTMLGGTPSEISGVEGLPFTVAGTGCAEAGTFSNGKVRVQKVIFTAKNSLGEAQGMWVE